MNAAVVLESVLALIGLWCFIVYFWRDYRLDAFRDEVFDLRDRLFMFAAQGGISFEHPAYAMLRERMNVVIRYAHEFSTTRVLVVLFTYNATIKNAAIVRWEKAVNELPEAVRTQITDFNVSLAFVVLKQMVYSTFLLYLVVRPSVSLIRRAARVDVRREVASRPQVVLTVERLESDALEQDARRLLVAEERDVAVTA